MAKWQLQVAKAQFSEVVRMATSKGPQVITLRGEPSVVVLSFEDYKRLKESKPSFVDFMQKSPLSGIDLDLERDDSPTRDVDL